MKTTNTAILTNSLPSTPSYPARIRAHAPSKGRLQPRLVVSSRSKIEGLCEMVGWPITEANIHRMAARLLCMEMKWESADLIGGNIGDDFVWVFPSGNPAIQTETPVSNS